MHRLMLTNCGALPVEQCIVKCNRPDSLVLGTPQLITINAQNSDLHSDSKFESGSNNSKSNLDSLLDSDLYLSSGQWSGLLASNTLEWNRHHDTVTLSTPVRPLSTKFNPVGNGTAHVRSDTLITSGSCELLSGAGHVRSKTGVYGLSSQPLYQSSQTHVGVFSLEPGESLTVPMWLRADKLGVYQLELLIRYSTVRVVFLWSIQYYYLCNNAIIYLEKPMIICLAWFEDIIYKCAVSLIS